MKKTNLSLALVAIVGAALTLSGTAMAESQGRNGTGALSATARVDFQVNVPKVLFLRVGTGANGIGAADNATINLITFDVAAGSVGNSTAVAATATSGDLGNGAVTASLMTNGGTVSLTSTTPGAMNTGVAAETLSYSNISVASTVLNSGTALPHPTLLDGATTTLSITPGSGKVVNRDARWTYSYANTAVVGAGSYGGAGTASAALNNGRATYTASIL